MAGGVNGWRLIQEIRRLLPICGFESGGVTCIL
jgi:hypothetical protein